MTVKGCTVSFVRRISILEACRRQANKLIILLHLFKSEKNRLLSFLSPKEAELGGGSELRGHMSPTKSTFFIDALPSCTTIHNIVPTDYQIT